MKCTKCESEKEPYFSRTEPMGYFCPDCGAEDKPGTKCKNPRCETTMSEGSPDFCPQCQDDREKLRERMDNFPNVPSQESTPVSGKNIKLI